MATCWGISSDGSSGGRAPDECGSGLRFGGRDVVRAMDHSVVASGAAADPDRYPRDGNQEKLSEIQGLNAVTGTSI